MFPSRDEKTGKFIPGEFEAFDRTPLNVKVTASMKARIKKSAGKDVSAWVRDAILQKLAQEEGMSA